MYIANTDIIVKQSIIALDFLFGFFTRISLFSNLLSLKFKLSSFFKPSIAKAIAALYSINLFLLLFVGRKYGANSFISVSGNIC